MDEFQKLLMVIDFPIKDPCNSWIGNGFQVRDPNSWILRQTDGAEFFLGFYWISICVNRMLENLVVWIYGLTWPIKVSSEASLFFWPGKRKLTEVRWEFPTLQHTTSMGSENRLSSNYWVSFLKPLYLKIRRSESNWQSLNCEAHFRHFWNEELIMWKKELHGRYILTDSNSGPFSAFKHIYA